MKISRITDALLNIAGLACISLPIIILVFVTIRWKYPQGIPLWSVDICQMLLWFITYLAAGYVIRVNGHVRVNVFLENRPPRTRKKIEQFTAFVCLLVGVLAAAAGTRATVVSWLDQRKTFNDLPEYLFAVVIPIGLIFMVFEMILYFRGQLRSNFKTSPKVQDQDR